MANAAMLEDQEQSAVPERLVPGSEAWRLYEVEHRQRYQWAARYCSGRRVLDVACGVGYGSEILRQAGATIVIGVDLAFEAFPANGHRAQTLFANAEACRLPFGDGTLDAVVSFETIEHVPHPERLLQEIRRVLKRDGICICSSPNRDFQPFAGSREPNPYHISEMSFAEFDRLFTKYFLVTERFSQSHSESYIRHLQLLRELDARLKPIRFSRLLRMENKIRQLLGRDSLNGLGSLPPQLVRAVSGDYLIEPLRDPATNLLTFIFVGEPKLG
jgi:ubiquinone/menaquinone biosynthesis C-methylase UbiE